MIAIDFLKAFDSLIFFFVPYLLLAFALLLSNGFTLFIIIFLAVFQTVVLLPHILTSSVALGRGPSFSLSVYYLVRNFGFNNKVILWWMDRRSNEGFLLMI